MKRNIMGRAIPSVAAIEAEAARVESMIVAATQRIESSGCNLRNFMHLQVCKAELHAYLAGLRYSQGETNLMEENAASPEFDFSELQVRSFENSFMPLNEEEDPRYVQCFEC